MRRGAILAIISALVLAVLPLTPGAASPGGSAAGSYIVVLKNGDAGKIAAEHSRRHGASVKHVYRHAIRGYAARMSAQAAARIARNPRVAYIEPDGVVTATTTQSNATWGLDRVDARSGLDTTYSYTETGVGVHAYVIDTGIRKSHTDFGNRVSVTDYYDAFGGTADDCNGHGTHVAGTIGGSTWGVAKAVNLVAVRVLDCSGSGTWSGVIAGLDWVTANAQKPAVANMSLGGGASTSVDDAVKRTIASGVTVAVAAGNGNSGGKEQDACNYSPARVPDAITIGATTKTDSKTSWSNYGSCVDWFAPGAGITSAWYTSDTSTNTISGTSMATPHVAGAAARYLEENPDASALAVRDALYADTTKGIVTSSKTANNHLLFTRLDYPDGGSTPTNTAPTASFTEACSGLTCNFTDASTDPDGSIIAWNWEFGDGGTSTATNPSHSYAAGGTYTVRLTVTDNAGATNTASHSVTVSAPSTVGFTLGATPYKVKGVQHVDLAWSGATAGSVDVYRNSSWIATVTGSAHTDNIGVKGGGSYTYKVCDAGTQTCSNEATVTF